MGWQGGQLTVGSWFHNSKIKMSSSTTLSGTRSRKRPFVDYAKLARAAAAAGRKMARAGRIPRSVNMGPDGMPKMLTIVHRYVCEPGRLITVPTAGGIGIYQFSTNSLNDPDTTGAGHQPYYYDQLLALYNHWCVTESECIVTGFAPGLAVTMLQWGVYIEDDTTVTPSNVGAMETITSKHHTTATSSGESKKLKLKWNARAAFGGNPMSDSELQGASGANPTEQQYFTLFVMDQTALAVATFPWYFSVEIRYKTVWSELKNIGAS